MATNNTFSSSLYQPVKFESDGLSQSQPDFHDEAVRLESYTRWPRSAQMRPKELARAGFYFLDRDDRVQCAFCKGVLRNWQSDDDALEEHQKHFPTCPFILDPDAAGNVPAKSDVQGVHLRKCASNYQREEDLGILRDRAHHPEMAKMVDRVNSFKQSYNTDSARTPHEFAEAGFFSTGQGDNVKCFFCDGGLRNWERNDEPWLEHARWFPKCGYLRNKKGDLYVERTRKHRPLPGVKKPKLKKLKKKYEVDPAQLKRIMSSEDIKEVANMGFAEAQIRKAVESRLAELGSEFPNMESLVDMIYEQQKMARKDTECESEPDDDEEQTMDTEEIKPNESTKEPKPQNKTEDVPMESMTEENADRLQAEVDKLRDGRLCKICMDKDVNIVFLKCGHLMCCSDCAPVFRHCPLCRQVIRGTICAHLSGN